MKKIWLLLIVLFAAGLTTSLLAQSTNVDLEQVAADLVNKCADISEGEIVMVSGGVKDLELLENIAVDVRKKGAFPFLTISSDRMTRKMFTEVPEKYDSQEPKLGMNMVKFVDAQITVSSGESPDLLADIPPERFAKRSEARKPLMEYIEKNPIKLVQLGNGMYPTKANAEEFGISVDQLSDIFWAGINTDYEKLSSTGKKLETTLADGNELEITNANGTNLKVNVKGRKAYCSDGVISKEDLKKGTAGYSVYLPAGEVYLAPISGSANGKVVVDNFNFMGKPVKGLVLEFKDGKVVSMDAQSGFEQFKKYYDAQGKGLDEFAFIDFGINQNVKIPQGSKFQSWMPAGMVTIGIGNNIWAGGDNDANSGVSFFIPYSSVKLDGKPLVENGNLKL